MIKSSRNIYNGTMNHWRTIIVVGILVFIAALHIYKLSDIPPGLSNDEANIGYEAWSIATTGKDQWGHTLPIVFEGFGNWSLPIYIYMLAPFVRIFGPTIIAVRFLSTLSVVALSWLSYSLVKELGKTSKSLLSLFSLTLIGITPWIFGLSRTANEVLLATTFFMAGLVLFLKSQRQKTAIVGAMIFFAISMLTYYGMWVFVPLFLFTLYIIRRKTIVFQKRDLIAGMVILLFTSSALTLITIQQGGNKRLGQVNIFNDPALVGTLNEKRGSCAEEYPGALCQLFFNKPLLYFSTYVENYFSHFSIREWFITNSNKGILPPIGFFLLIQAPMFFLGVLALLKDGSKIEKQIFLSWLLLAPIADSVTSSGNFTRGFIIAPAIVIVSAYSFLFLKNIIRMAALFIVFLSAGNFFLLYTSLFPKLNSMYTHYEYQPLVGYLKDEKRPIYVSSRFRDTKQYIFLLFYGEISPRDFQRNANVVYERESNGWIWVKQVNNWHFLKSLPNVDDLPPDSIIVGGSKEEIEPFMKQYKQCQGILIDLRTIIRYRNNDPAFSVIEVKTGGQLECPKTGIL